MHDQGEQESTLQCCSYFARLRNGKGKREKMWRHLLSSVWACVSYCIGYAAPERLQEHCNAGAL
jgi:hypothetical protein